MSECVCESGRSTEGIQPELILAAELAMNTTVTSLLTQPAEVLAPNLRRRFVTAQEKN